MQLIFCEDIERDVENWRSSLVTQNNYVGDFRAKYLPKDILPEKIGDKEYLREYLDERFYKTGKIIEFKTWLEANANSAEIQEDLERLMGVKFLSETITAYITALGLGRYHVQGDLFYVIYRSPERDRKMRITNIYHELMHFLFHWHYWDQCKEAGLSEQEINNLKESLTVLLNPVLEKRGLPSDGGYPVHEELRKKWAALYKGNSDFPVFLEGAILLYKKSLIN